MPKRVSWLLMGLSLLALNAVPAHAGQANFFDLLFGNHHRANGQQQDFGFNNASPWWENQQKQQNWSGNRNFNGGVYGNDGADPEQQVTGLGMGTLTYVPPMVTPVYDSS